MGVFEDIYQKAYISQESTKLICSEFCQFLLLSRSHVDPLESIQTEMLNGPPNTQESYLSLWYMSVHAAELPCTAWLSWAKIDGQEMRDGFSRVLQCSLLRVKRCGQLHAIDS